MKQLFIDVETTGISPWEHSITQIAAILEINGVIESKITLDIAPIPGSKIDEEALKITGKTLDEILAYPSASQQIEVFIEFLQKHVSQYDKTDKLFFIAYNAPFDVEFMRAFFVRQGHKFFGSYFWTPAIDVMTLAGYFLKHLRAEMSNFKLSTVAEFLGLEISKDQLHDAYYDIQLTYKVYYALEKLSQNQPLPANENSITTTLIEPEVEFKDSLF